MKCLLACLFTLVLIASTSAAESHEVAETAVEDTSAASIGPNSDTVSTSQIVVYYLHGNRRCPTCMKLEAYSQEAVHSGFAEELEDSILVWQVINFEEDGNEHYVKDYKLYAQSLVLSRVRNGEEVEWRNLDRIWKLVGSKEKYIEYVTSELQSFMEPTKESTEKPTGE